MKHSLRSYIHVIIQFFSIFYIISTGPVFLQNLFMAPVILGVLLGLWSIWIMKRTELSIFPDPEPKFRLIRSGPYKIVRHPMYLSLFLVLVPLVTNQPSLERILISIVFTINQILKILYEETLITGLYPEYANYKSETWRILPYIF